MVTKVKIKQSGSSCENITRVHSENLTLNKEFAYTHRTDCKTEVKFVTKMVVQAMKLLPIKPTMTTRVKLAAKLKGTCNIDLRAKKSNLVK